MIMVRPDISPARSPLPMRPSDPLATTASPRVRRLLGERLELVEELWQTVLRSECPPEQAERLLRLKQLSDPVALQAPAAPQSATSAVIVALTPETHLA